MKKTVLQLFAVCCISAASAQVPGYVTQDSLVGFWDFNGNTTNELTGGTTLPNGTQGYGADRNNTPNAALNSGEATATDIAPYAGTQVSVGGWVKMGLVSNPASAIEYYSVIFNAQVESMTPGGPGFIDCVNLSYISDWEFDPNSIGNYIPGPNHGRIAFSVRVSGILFPAIVFSSTNYTTDAWRHVMGTYDGSYLRLYVDGSCTDSLLVNGALNFVGSGQNSNAGFKATNTFAQSALSQASLDLMGYWRKALSACEVENLYNGFFTPCNLDCSSINTTISQNGNTLAPAYNENAASYLWINCNTNQAITTGREYSPLQAGDYKVVISYFSCQDTSDCFSFTPQTTGTEDVEMTTISVYPNPATDMVTVSSAAPIHILMMDLTGRIVWQSTVKQTHTSIPVAELPSGIYFIRTDSGVTSRFVKAD